MAADAPTAFFSYSREDLEFALRLAKDLKKAGANVWMDKLDIRPGQLWEQKAEEALYNCARLLVILSPASISSRNVMAEVAFALDEQKEVIPVLYRDCKIPFRLRPFQYVDFRTDYSQGLEELTATVAVDQPAHAAPAPAAPAERRSVVVDRQVSDSPTHEKAPFEEKSTELKVCVLRELRTLTGHANAVRAVAMTPDGQYVVSASDDKTLKLWELGRGREGCTFTGHAAEVRGVAVTPDGQQAVSASWDKTLKVWELSSGRELRSFTGHSGPVYGVAVTPDGQRALSVSYDKTLKVWDLASGHELRTLTGHSLPGTAVTVTPDGQYAVSTSWRELRVWELASGRKALTLTGHSGYVRAVAVTPDGQHALSASDDKTLKLWELGTGREGCTFTGHAAEVRGAAVTPDGQRSLSASFDRTLKVWELGSGRELATFEVDAPLYCCAVCPDGKTILTGDKNGVIHVLRLE